jgi:hypothetical protein
MLLKYFIVNDMDRPNKRCVTVKLKEGYFCYLDRSFKEYDGMNPNKPTPLEEFGFDIKEEDGAIFFKRVKESTAKYKDGKCRPWQGEDEFSHQVLVKNTFKKGSGHKG